MAEALARTVGNAQTPPTRLQESLRQLYPPYKLETNEFPAETPGTSFLIARGSAYILLDDPPQTEHQQEYSDSQKHHAIRIDRGGAQAGWLNKVEQTVEDIQAGNAPGNEDLTIVDVAQGESGLLFQIDDETVLHDFEVEMWFVPNGNKILQKALQEVSRPIDFDENYPEYSIEQTLTYAHHVGTILQALSLRGGSPDDPIQGSDSEIFITHSQEPASFQRDSIAVNLVTVTEIGHNNGGASRSLTVPVDAITFETATYLMEESRGDLARKILSYRNNSGTTNETRMPLMVVGDGRSADSISLDHMDHTGFNQVLVAHGKFFASLLTERMLYDE
jgi:hypothetical protein